MKDFLTSLAENFRERFENCPKLSGDILLFRRQTFSVSMDCRGQDTGVVPYVDEASLQMEIVEHNN